MSRRKILVVDDSPVILEWVRTALEEAGFSVTALDNPLMVAHLIRKEQPDLVLLDVNMPAAQGDFIAASALKYGITKRILVLLHSDLPADQLQERAQRAGASGFISKTTDKEEFINQVKHWLREPRR